MKSYLEEVKLFNFRGVLGEKKYNFLNKDGFRSNVILLAGPNGFGKTTLLEAIEWCVTGQIYRVKKDYELRCKSPREKDINNSKKGLLRNINAEGAEVRVEIELSFNDSKIKIVRKFDNEDEYKGVTGESSVEFISEDVTKKAQLEKIFIELKDKFNYDNIASYEKNIEMYRTSREGVHKIFENMFFEFEKINDIEKNIEAYLEHIKNKKIEEDNRFDKYKENKVNLEKIIKNECVFDDLNIKEYPKEKLYDSEIILGEIENIEEISKFLDKLIEQKRYINNQIKISLVQDIEDEKRNIKNRVKLEKVDYLIKLYESKQKEIEKYKRGNFEKIERALDELNKLKEKYVYKYKKDNIKEFYIDNKKYLNLKEVTLLDVEYKKYSENVDNINKLEEYIKQYSNENSIMKIMRYLVDNKKDFNEYKKESDICPLCGSNNYKEKEIVEEAKKFLGEADKNRQEAVKRLSQIKNNNKIILSKVERIIINSLDDKINKLNSWIELRENISYYLENISILKLDVKKIDKVYLENEKRILEEKKYIKNNLLENLIGELDSIPDEIKNELEIYNNQDKRKKLKLLKKVQDLIILDSDIIKYEKELDLDTLKRKKNIITLVISKIENNINIKKLKDIDEKIKNLEKTIKNLEEKKKIFKNYQRNIKKEKSEIEKKEINKINKPVANIFRKITRNTNIQNLKIEKATRTAKKSSLKIIDFNNNEVPFGNIMSTGQVSTLALSIYLAKAMVNKEKDFRVYLMDDPIQSMDDLNIISFIDIIRYQFMKKECERYMDQVLISTCDKDLEKFIEHRMESFNVKISKQEFIDYIND